MSSSAPTWPAALNGRSLGIKLIVVGVLAMAMTLPALFVYSLVEDRTTRAGQVAAEISKSVGGSQVFLGPVLAGRSAYSFGGETVRTEVGARC